MISIKRISKDDVLRTAIREKNELLINYLLEKYQDFNANYQILAALESNNFKLVDYFGKKVNLQKEYNFWRDLIPKEMKVYIGNKYNIVL